MPNGPLSRSVACLAALALLGSTACVRIAASVSHPTALERQLLGEYERLDDELVWASSVRGAQGGAAPSFEVLRAQAVEERAIQRYNEDDLLELKEARCVAEASDARVVARAPCSKAGDEAARKLLTRVVREENSARDAILLWAAHELSRRDGRLSPTPEELVLLRKTYARLLREAAKPGHLTEVSPGEFREVSRTPPGRP